MIRLEETKRNRMRKITFRLLISAMVAIVATSCYDDFEQDNPFSAVYFPFQKPIRTVQLDDPNFKIGVTLGGKRTNDDNEIVGVTLAPELLEDPDKEVLPESHYTLDFPASESTITIPKGSFIGTASVSLTEAFLNDPLSVTDHYVLPLRIVKFSTDSVLEGKDFTLTAVKYINKFQGSYYRIGTDLPTVGDPFTYSQPDLERNIIGDLNTTGRDKVKYSNLGITAAASELTVNADNSVTFTLMDTTAQSVSSTGSTYDPDTRKFNLRYDYVDTLDVSHSVSEELIYIGTILKLEEW